MLKMIIWSLICVGLGIFLARFPLDGKTAVDRAEQQWQDKKVSEKVEGAVHDAKSEVKKVIAKDGPSETHTKDDRASIDKLLAKRADR